jgi:hypothetical protein
MSDVTPVIMLEVSLFKLKVIHILYIRLTILYLISQTAHADINICYFVMPFYVYRLL